MPPMRKILRWTDGQELRGSRIKRVFAEGRLLRYERRGAERRVVWFARCTAPQCTNEYNLSKSYRPPAIRALCAHHLGKVRIGGRFFSSEKIAERNIVAWRTVNRATGARRVPLVQCEHPDGCDDTVIAKKRCPGRPSLCATHSRQWRRLRPYEATYNLFLASQRIRNQARAEPIAMALTYQQFAKICTTQPNCFYCGIDVGRVPYTGLGKRGIYYTRSAYLDRLDVNQGYTRSNVVTCCGICNMTRNVWVSVEEMLIIAQVRAGNVRAVAKLMRKHERGLADWAAKVVHLRRLGARAVKSR